MSTATRAFVHLPELQSQPQEASSVLLQSRTPQQAAQGWDQQLGYESATAASKLGHARRHIQSDKARPSGGNSIMPDDDHDQTCLDAMPLTYKMHLCCLLR